MDLATIAVAIGAALGSGGIIALVRIAVGSSERRADDWREIARTCSAANAVMSEHVAKLVSAVEQLTAAQRESLAILQGMARERREAA